MQVGKKKPRNSFYIYRHQRNLLHFVRHATCCLFYLNKSHLFYNSILFCSNVTHIFINHVQKFKYSVCWSFITICSLNPLSDISVPAILQLPEGGSYDAWQWGASLVSCIAGLKSLQNKTLLAHSMTIVMQECWEPKYS